MPDSIWPAFMMSHFSLARRPRLAISSSTKGVSRSFRTEQRTPIFS
jgi:hypothetical protein